MHRHLILAVALSLAACGGADDADDGAGQSGVLTATVAASFEGIYQTTVLTEDSTGCEGTGSEDSLASTPDPAS